MKNIHKFISLLILLTSFGVNAQLSSNYSFSKSVGAYKSISANAGATVFKTGSWNYDDVSSPIAIPSFDFNGNTYTSLQISAMGYIVFDTIVPNKDNAPISSSAAYGGVIAACANYTNNSNSSYSSIMYQQVGSEFIIQWTANACYNHDGYFSFQVRLNTCNGIIKLVYDGSMNQPTSNKYAARQVGLRGASNSDFLSRTCSSGKWYANDANSSANTATCNIYGAGNYPDNGLTYTYTPTSGAAAVVDTITYNTVSTSAVAAGQKDVPILRMDITVTGLTGSQILDTVTIVSNNTWDADITAVKLYISTSNVFSANTATQIGSSTTFTAGKAQYNTLNYKLSCGITYLYVVYDLSNSPAVNDTIDVKINSSGIHISGATYPSSDQSPFGYRLFANARKYISSKAFQPNNHSVEKGSTQQEIIGLQIIISDTGASVNLDSIVMNTTGNHGTNNATTNIQNAKMWYTGNYNTFATTTQYGSNTTAPNGQINFVQKSPKFYLDYDTNYFWLTYDIKSGANTGDTADARVAKINLGGASYTPSITNPAGYHPFKSGYCTPSNYSNTPISGVGITKVVLAGINNATATSSTITNATHRDYTSQHASVKKSLSYTLNADVVNGGSYPQYTAAWIDWNNDGDFDDAGEKLKEDIIVADSGTFTINFTVPCSAVANTTRMRIRSEFYANGGGLDPCNYNFAMAGETEDYSIDIIDSPRIVTSIIASQPDTSYLQTGQTNMQLMMIRINTQGCGALPVGRFDFSTTGSSSAAGDINDAKVWYTGSSNIYTTTSQFGATVSAPNGAFSITGSKNIVTDSAWFWLSYSLTSGATIGNDVDAEIRYIIIDGVADTPNVVAPAGHRVIHNCYAHYTYIDSGLKVDFDNQSISNNYYWTFGDGDTSILKSPSHAYSSSGTYNVCLINCNDTICKKIAVNSNTNCKAPFKITVINYTGTFNDLSQVNGGTPSFYWNFGDGNTSTTQSPVHTYSSAGTYYITHAISTTTGCTDSTYDTVVVNPMTYISSDAFHTGNLYVQKGTINQEIIGLQVVTSASGSPLSMDNIIFNTQGSTTASDISNASVYYTGNNNIFSNTKAYGLVIASPSGQMSFSSSTITLNNDTNYFWLTYDIVSGAVTYDTVDAKVVSIKAGGTTYTPSVTNPAGYHIVSNYCTPDNYSNSSTIYYGITKVVLAGINNASSVPKNNATHSDYTNIHATVKKQVSYSLTVDISNSGYNNQFTAAWIDWNKDGDFDDAGEKLGEDSISNTSGTNTFNFTVPCNSKAGTTLMRVRTEYYANGGGLDPCYYNYNVAGETEDYSIVISDSVRTITSIEASQPDTSYVSVGSANNQILKIRINSSGCGNVAVANFDFSTNGSSNASNDISVAKLWYTGTSDVFATTTQYGPTSSSPLGVFYVNGSTSITTDSAFYWLSYNIASGAATNNKVDAEIRKVYISSNYYTPTDTAPAGSRPIANASTTCNAKIKYQITNLSVLYTDSSYTNSGNITSYNWDFGDGDTAIGKSPNHTYINAGTYYVTLAIYTTTGCTDTAYDSVVVTSGGGTSCAAYYSYTQNLDTVFFKGSATNTTGNVTYAWDFGDNTGASQQSPTHIYSSTGNYYICLKITDTNCTNTYCSNVNVNTQNTNRYTLAGNVMAGNAYGYPAMVWAIVYDTAAGTLTAVDSVNTDSIGHYIFNLNQGHYLVKTALDSTSNNYSNYLPTYYNNKLHWDTAYLINLDSNKYNINITMIQGNNPGGPGFIGGKTSQGANKTEAVGDPLPNIQIDLLDANKKAVAYTYSDAQGNFKFNSLPYGTYYLHPEIFGKKTVEMKIILSASNHKVEYITVEVNRFYVTSYLTITSIGSAAKESGIEIWPNPATDNLYIKSEKTISQINFTDITGKQIMNIYKPQNTLDISNLEAGLYIIQITTKDGLNVTYKFVKNR